MSKYLTFPLAVFANRELLIEALRELGYPEVEEGEGLHLFGYMGDRRDETAEIIVRRNHLGSASNDLGFRRVEGGYEPVISAYDQRALRAGKFLPALRATYNEAAVKQLARNTHGNITRTVEGNKVKIVIRR